MFYTYICCWNTFQYKYITQITFHGLSLKLGFGGCNGIDGLYGLGGFSGFGGFDGFGGFSGFARFDRYFYL